MKIQWKIGILTIFEKLFLNRAFGNNFIFLQQFFLFLMGISLVPPGYATGNWNIQVHSAKIWINNNFGVVEEFVEVDIIL